MLEMITTQKLVVNDYNTGWLPARFSPGALAMDMARHVKKKLLFADKIGNREQGKR